MLRVLIDLRPRLLAETVAIAIAGPDVAVEVAEQVAGVHDERGYDVVIVDDDVRASRPGAVTVRVDPERGADLMRVLDVVDLARAHAPPARTHPDR